MKRHHITLGAKTTAGGIVITATSVCTIEDKQMALDGDTIDCPSCRSIGTIRCIGPRIPETWNGKDAALENDLCICKCTPPPRLLAAQALKYQAVDGMDNWWRSPANLAPAEHGESFDQRVLMTDSLTGVPLAYQPYRLASAGEVLEGITDADGFTKPIPTGMRSEQVEWSVMGETT